MPIINLGRPKLAAGHVREAGSIAGTALAVVGTNILLMLLLAAAFGQPLLISCGVGHETRGLVWPIAIAIAIGAISGAFWEGVSFLIDRFDTYVRAGIIAAVGDMLLVAGGAAAFRPAWGGVGNGRRDARPFCGLCAADRARFPCTRVAWQSVGEVQVAPAVVHLFGDDVRNRRSHQCRADILQVPRPGRGGSKRQRLSSDGHQSFGLRAGLCDDRLLGASAPSAAAHGDTPEVRRELSRSLHLGLLISFTGCGVAAVTAPVIISIFYSRAFADAASLLVAYMPGELCFQLFSMLVAYQLTVSLRRNYLGLNLGYIALLVGAGIALIPSLGGGGYVAAHVAASFVMAIAALFIAANRGQIELIFGRQVGGDDRCSNGSGGGSALWPPSRLFDAGADAPNTAIRDQREHHVVPALAGMGSPYRGCDRLKHANQPARLRCKRIGSCDHLATSVPHPVTKVMIGNQSG